MDYTYLLIKQYAFVKAAHELADVLKDVKAIGGKIVGPPEYAEKFTNFCNSLDALSDCYTGKGSAIDE